MTMQFTDSQNIKQPSDTVSIPDEVNLNDLPICPASQKWDTGQMGHDEQNTLASFADDVFLNLPPSLQKACSQLFDDDEKGTLLTGSLGALSSILPNAQGLYDGKLVGPGLFVFITAPFGTGKGGLDYVRKLVQPVHQSKRNQHEQELEDFRSAQLVYENEVQLFKKNKSGEPPIPPKRPPNQMLIIPANSSKTAIIQTIAENGGNALIFETEGDTLADAVKQDYGNFSDVLRKSYHHEPIGFLRRGNDGEFFEVNKPQLSLVVSSTPSQLISLIPSAENGLFSRFIFYRIRPNPAFKDVFDHRKNEYDKFFSDLGAHYHTLFDLLNKRSVDDPVRFKLSITQQQRFLPFFQTVKDDVRENVGDDMAGSINRLGLICFRICMIFSIIRVYDDTGNVPRLLVCKDQDFDNVLLMLETLKRHALSVYWGLPKPKIKSAEEGQDESKVVQKRRCRELFEQGLSYRDIATQILGSANKRQTVYRWINQ